MKLAAYTLAIAWWTVLTFYVPLNGGGLTEGRLLSWAIQHHLGDRR